MGNDGHEDVIPIVLGGKLVVDGTPCIIYKTNSRLQATSLKEQQHVLGTWEKSKIALHYSGEEELFLKEERIRTLATLCMWCFCSPAYSSIRLVWW